MRWVMGYSIALCLLLIIVSQSIIFPTFFMPFYRWQYQRLSVANTVQMETDELMRVTVELLDYMRNRRDSIADIRAVVAGEERDFFSEIEIKHMVDVLHLYDIAFMVRNVAFFVMLGLILGMVLLKYKILFVLSRCCREVLAGFLLLTALLVGIIAINFERAFDIFHRIFFNNDYWILDPRVDLLINMVPIYFFIHISIFIAALILVSSLIIIIAGTLYLRYMPRTGFNQP